MSTHSSLHNIVGESIIGKTVELRRVDQLLDHAMACVLVSDADALLNDIGAELLAGEIRDMAEEGAAELLREGVFTLID